MVGRTVFVKENDETHQDDAEQEMEEYDQADYDPHLQRTAQDAPSDVAAKEGLVGGRQVPKPRQAPDRTASPLA